MATTPRSLVCLCSSLTVASLVIFIVALWNFLRSTVQQQQQQPTIASYQRLYQQILKESNRDGDLQIQMHHPDSYEYKALRWMWQYQDDVRDHQFLQRHSLVTIFLSFDWTVPISHECTWHPLIACDEDANVIAFNMTNVPSTILSSTIPLAFRFLSHLQFLDVSHQQLQGTLPPLSQLQELRVPGNQNLQLTLPPSLQVLDWSDNDLLGLPSFAELTHLRFLDLSGNHQLNRLILLDELHYETLEYLNIAETNISGTFPPTANYSALHVLAASHAPIRGVLPQRLVRQAKQLRILQLGISGWANLSGTFPNHVQWRQMEQLSLVRTQMSGTLPARWGEIMTNLRAIDLYDNPNLVGTIPEEWKALTSLQVARFVDTGLSGSIPSWLASWSKLQALSLHRTMMTGDVPEEICALPFLTRLTANCGGDNPLLNCTCCTFCWSRGD